MSDQSDRESSEHLDEQSDNPSRPVSQRKLIIAIAIMLLPAGVPLYFALVTEGTTSILLLALTVFVAAVNATLVYGVWRWLNSAGSAASEQ